MGGPRCRRARPLTKAKGLAWCFSCVQQVLLLVTWSLSLLVLPANLWAAHGSEIPCTYVGHLLTDENWHGFLANITIMSPGRMTFEFTYPADKCCMNILFYTEDQLAEISNHMTCWQKEYLLLPGNDQILRLTPRFTWSGCHITYPNRVPHYDCVGGRSFASQKATSRPTTWYLAVSNCAGISGLDLEYRMRVYGHLGDCKPGYRVLTTTAPTTPETPRVDEIKPGTTSSQVADKACIIEGNLNTSVNWYGFLTNMTLQGGGGFKFLMNYPYDMQKQNVILYNEEDITLLGPELSCWDKEGIIRKHKDPERILDLSWRSTWNGCKTKNYTNGRNLTCHGERRYNGPRKVFMAVSNCWSKDGLVLHYRLEVTGYKKGTCSGASSNHLYHCFYRTRGQHCNYWIYFLTSHLNTWISIAVIIYMQLGYLSPHLALSRASVGPGLLASDSQESISSPKLEGSDPGSGVSAAATSGSLRNMVYEIR